MLHASQKMNNNRFSRRECRNPSSQRSLQRVLDACRDELSLTLAINNRTLLAILLLLLAHQSVPRHRPVEHRLTSVQAPQQAPARRVSQSRRRERQRRQQRQPHSLPARVRCGGLVGIGCIPRRRGRLVHRHLRKRQRRSKPPLRRRQRWRCVHALETLAFELPTALLLSHLALSLHPTTRSLIRRNCKQSGPFETPRT